MEPDRNKPVKMITKYDETSILTAGGKLPGKQREIKTIGCPRKTYTDKVGSGDLSVA